MAFSFNRLKKLRIGGRWERWERRERIAMVGEGMRSDMGAMGQGRGDTARHSAREGVRELRS